MQRKSIFLNFSRLMKCKLPLLLIESLLLFHSYADKNVHPLDEPASAESEASWPKPYSFFFFSFDHLLNAFFTHSQCDPPLMVHDLLAEVRDGQVLMALLEQLSGCKLVRIVPKCGISLMPVCKVSETVKR